MFWTFSSLAELEAQFVSFERVRLLTEIPQEAA